MAFSLAKRIKAFRMLWIQIVASLTAAMSYMVYSMAYVWPSPAIPKLMQENSTLPITLEEGSWFAPLAMVGLVMALPCTVFLVHKFGSKVGILLVCIPAATSWLLVAFAVNLPMLYVARLLVGAIDGFCFQSVPMYVCEITQPEVRGRLLAIAPALMYLGNIVTYSVGYILSISNYAYLALSVTLLLFCSVLFIPQSPYYQLTQGDEAAARRTLQTLRRRPDVEVELQTIRSELERERAEAHSSSPLDLFTVPLNRKAVYISLVLCPIQNFCGLTSITNYVHLIFIEAEIELDEIIPATLFGVVQLLSVFITTALVDRLGRRPLIIISSIGLSVCLFLEGGYFFMKDYGYNVSAIKWLPVLALLVYIVFVTIGVGTVPFIYYGEIFQTSVRSYGLALVNVTFGALGIVSTKAFQLVSDSVGMFAMFWIFATLTLIELVFMYKMLPETKNKTLAEIQEMIKLGKRY